jgi:uroporphyrinogen decarboxylase
VTSKERMNVALRHGVPDRVPVCPDMSNMIPCRLTGKPFWQIYLHNDPPLGSAYREAVKKYGFDGWYIYGYLPGGRTDLGAVEGDDLFFLGCTPVPRSLVNSTVLAGSEGTMVEESSVETPLGAVSFTTVYPPDVPPWHTAKMIKDLRTDWPRVRWFFGEEWAWAKAAPDRDVMGDMGVYALPIDLPIDWWYSLRHGNMDVLIFDLFDEVDLMKEIFEYYAEYSRERLAAMLTARPDEIWIHGSSSSLSVISPDLFRRFNLPFLQMAARMCKEAGIPSHLHVCGRSRGLLGIVANETNVDAMEPLEPSPGGDCDLGEVKATYGDRLALKGNVNTFDVLLRATPEEVGAAARTCIEQAAEGGGFILATGDQCARDTPDENIFALVEAAEKYGKY